MLGNSKVSMIAAVAKNNVIGDGVKMGANGPDDMTHFRGITEDNVVVMGRRTMETIGQALQGRLNIVLSRSLDEGYYPGGFIVVDGVETLETLLEDLGWPHIFIIGGGEMYRQFLELADAIHINQLGIDLLGTVTFPDIPEHEFTLVSEKAEFRKSAPSPQYVKLYREYVRSYQSEEMGRKEQVVTFAIYELGSAIPLLSTRSYGLFLEATGHGKNQGLCYWVQTNEGAIDITNAHIDAPDLDLDIESDPFEYTIRAKGHAPEFGYLLEAVEWRPVTELVDNTSSHAGLGFGFYEGKWYKNGDHPADYAEPVDGFENGELTEFSPAFQRENDWEGQVVRRYRRPDVSGTIKCGRCGYRLHDHGWIDQGENGVTVCPGSEIIKVNGLWFTVYDPLNSTKG